MNQARTGRHYYDPSDFDEPRGMRPWLVVTLVAMACFSHVGAIAFGRHLAQVECAQQKAALAAAPRRVVVQQANALTQWSCSAAERREYTEACKRRLIGERIKPQP